MQRWHAAESGAFTPDDPHGLSAARFRLRVAAAVWSHRGRIPRNGAHSSSVTGTSDGSTCSLQQQVARAAAVIYPQVTCVGDVRGLGALREVQNVAYRSTRRVPITFRVPQMRYKGMRAARIPDWSAVILAPLSRDLACVSIDDVDLFIRECRRERAMLHSKGTRSDCGSPASSTRTRSPIATMKVIGERLAPVSPRTCCARRATRHLRSIFEFKACTAKRCR